MFLWPILEALGFVLLALLIAIIILCVIGYILAITVFAIRKLQTNNYLDFEREKQDLRQSNLAIEKEEVDLEFHTQRERIKIKQEIKESELKNVAPIPPLKSYVDTD